MTQMEDITYIRKTLHDRGICVIIPTFNNVESIKSVVEDALIYCNDVIVVDDGSNDGTTDILRTINDITLVSYPRNRGKGHALKCGFSKALEMGFAYAITMDADGQHKAKDIPLFLKANQQWPGSIILGSRDDKEIVRAKGCTFANKFSNFWFSVETLHHIPDTQTGFRLYPLKKLYGYKLLTSRYEAELELIVFASWHGVKLHSIPINVYYPPIEERVSHFRPGLDFTRISILNSILCGLAVVYGLPLLIFRKATTFIRTVVVLLSILLMFVFFSPTIWLYVKASKMTERKKWQLHLLIYRVMRFIIFKIGIPGAYFSYSVDKSVDFNTPSVIICNHQSHLDLMYLLALTPKIIFLTNDWVWHNPLYSFLIRHAEYYPASQGIETLMPHFESLISRGYSIAIFPEGTRSADCRIARFHKGAFYVARQLGVSILPIFLYGTGRILKKNTYHMSKSPVYLEVRKAVSTDEFKNIGDDKDVMRYFHHIYLRHFEEISNKKEQNV